MKKIRIARAGGGTGGHVFPIKSLIAYLQTQPQAQQIQQQYRFWSKASLEQETCAELQKTITNLAFLPIQSGKLRREKSFWAWLKNGRDFFLFLIGFFQSLYFLIKYQIDLVFCKGGYVALPVVLAAKVLWKKILVHESDVHPGLVNRIAGRFSTANFSGFPWVLPKTQVVGQILSDELISSELSKKSSKQTQVLVMWGSQGSKNLYEALVKILRTEPQLQEMQFTIILGKLNQELNQLFASFSNVKTLDFVTQQEIGALYMQSDIAITRAGTTSLAEQELFDLKLVMVPIPRTHDQLDNAKRYVKYKDWILIQQDDPRFLPKLAQTLKSLIHYKKTLSSRDRKAEIAEAKKTIIAKLF